jgi:hypothetical protein
MEAVGLTTERGDVVGVYEVHGVVGEGGVNVGALGLEIHCGEVGDCDSSRRKESRCDGSFNK